MPVSLLDINCDATKLYFVNTVKERLKKQVQICRDGKRKRRNGKCKDSLITFEEAG